MRRFLEAPLGALLFVCFVSGQQILDKTTCDESNKDTIYPFSATTLVEEEHVDMSSYKGKVALVVNVATY